MEKQNNQVSGFRIFVATGLVLIFGWFLYQIWDSDVVYQYRQHYASNNQLSLDFKNINSNTTEQEIKKNYPLKWSCRQSTVSSLGDYECFDSLRSWNGASALIIVAWFKNKKLSALKIDIPFWYHSKLIIQLEEQYGKPKNVYFHKKNRLKILKNLVGVIITRGEYKLDKSLNDQLSEWILPNRTMIVTNLENDLNLMGNSQILWKIY